MLFGGAGSLVWQHYVNARLDQLARSGAAPHRRRGGSDDRIRTDGNLTRTYLTLTYFRSTRGRGSPANTLPFLSTVPNSGPLPVPTLGLPP